MRYLAFATDYDNTLATHGTVLPEVIAALRRLRASGRCLILVTGRELPDLLAILPEIELFDRVVAENGALLYRPHDRSQTLLAPGAPPEFIDELRRRGVPLSSGHSIVATVQPHETAVLECIRELGLELQVIFNREAVMVLPSGINKASGLRVALEELKLSPHNVVAAGDGENDHAFIDVSECAVAVANAVLSLQHRADFLTTGIAGEGVLQVIDAILRDDFSAADEKLTRHHVIVGIDDTGRDVLLSPITENLLLAGGAREQRSPFVTALYEQIRHSGYQWCVIDPQGLYCDCDGLLSFGSARQAPDLDEVLRVLEEPGNNVSVNLSGVAPQGQPTLMTSLLESLTRLRLRVGRPHCVLLNDAQVLPSWHVAASASYGVFMITPDQELLPGEVARRVTTLLVTGTNAAMRLGAHAHLAGINLQPANSRAELPPDEALLWRRASNSVQHIRCALDPREGQLASR